MMWCNSASEQALIDYASTSNAGQLLSRFAEKNVTLKVYKNPLENSITWRTKRPSLDSQEIEVGSQDEVTNSQVVYEDFDIQYLVFVFEAEDQDHYQAPHDPAKIVDGSVLVLRRFQAEAGLLTNFTGVHSRLCFDEAEVADHFTGLMPILADSYYKIKRRSSFYRSCARRMHWALVLIR